MVLPQTIGVQLVADCTEKLDQKLNFGTRSVGNPRDLSLSGNGGAPSGSNMMAVV